MANKVAIWVPALAKYGMGHFYRTYSLYEDINESFYFFNQKPEFQIKERHHTFESSNAKSIISFLQQYKVKCLLIDNYFIPKETLNSLSSLTSKEIRILFFDRDNSAPNFDAIWNNNPFITPEKFYSRGNANEYFLGENYYFFRKELRYLEREVKKENYIFICIGGADTKHLTHKIIKYLPDSYHYEITLGRVCKKEYVKYVETQAKKHLSSYEVYHDPHNFFQTLSRCSKALISASTLSYEASYLQVPFIAFQTAENQSELVKYLKKNNIAVIEDTENIKLIPDLIKDRKFKNINIRFGKKKDKFIRYITEGFKDETM